MAGPPLLNGALPNDPAFLFDRIALVASDAPLAIEALAELRASLPFPETPLSQASVVVALGGDGFVLEVLQHKLQRDHQYLFAMNRGTVGFLTNDYAVANLIDRIQRSSIAHLQPLHVKAVDMKGEPSTALAFNEAALFRETRQTASISVAIDGEVYIPDLRGDGILVATPAGSTAYNYSARGPVLPLDSDVLAVTPLNPFRPRGWRGAVIKSSSVVSLEVNNPYKRPVSLVTDSIEHRDMRRVEIRQAQEFTARLLFDHNAQLAKRIIREAFSV